LLVAGGQLFIKYLEVFICHIYRKRNTLRTALFAFFNRLY